MSMRILEMTEEYMTAAEMIDYIASTLKIFQAYGCPVCSGDCVGANPPPIVCPMEMIQRSLCILDVSKKGNAYADAIEEFKGRKS